MRLMSDKAVAYQDFLRRRAAEQGSTMLLEAILRYHGYRPADGLSAAPPASRKAHRPPAPTKRSILRRPRQISPDDAATMERIKAGVASFCKVGVEDMAGRCAKPMTVHARQVAIYLIRNRTEMSLNQIGREFGGRDHTTVIHASRVVDERRSRSVLYDMTIRNVEASL